MLAWEDIFAALRWWGVLLLLGTAVTPLAFLLFKRLPDRGYAFVKMLGLLLVSYIFWMLGSLGFLQNNLGGILAAFAIVIGLSLWAYRRIGGELRAWIWGQWTQILLTELIFLALFGLWVWVRAQNPAIAATEKPMEFAFLNAVGRSPTFPPVDPWLSGFAISYYYFGYVMTSVLGRLAAVSEPVAFNLGLAWLVAGTGVGAFGLVYNLIMSYGRSLNQKAHRLALTFGLMAALALPIGGNLQIILEAAHGNNIGSAQFWQWLDVRDINNPPLAESSPRYDSSGWWWWRSSRVINEQSLAGEPILGLEPIAEFPGFSFILGDLHPHVLALPFAFLSLAVAMLWWLEEKETGDWRLETERGKKSLLSNLQSLIPNRPLWLLTVLVLGGLSFLNTWDVLIHLFVVLGAFVLNRWRRHGWRSQWLADAFWLAVLLVIPAVLLYLPFYLGFRSQAGAPFLLPMLVRPTRLPQFLIIFGLPMIAIWAMLLSLTAQQKFKQWKSGLITAVSLIFALFLLALLLGWVVASSADGAGRMVGLANELGLTLAPRPEGPVAWGWGLTAVATILPTILQARLATPGVTLLLATLIGLVVMAWQSLFTGTQSHAEKPQKTTEENGEEFHPLTQAIADCPPPHPSNHRLPTPSPLPFVLLLIATGALLTLGPEFVYLRDNFGVRLNTVFKFYYQAWVMFGVAGLFGLSYLWMAAKEGSRKWVPSGVTVMYTAVFLLTLLFPYYAIQSRAIEYRGPIESANRQPATLNGLAQMATFRPDDYAAVLWLRENVSGTPTIVEAIGGQYSPEGHGRISASTGIPTLLGWAGHEYQWRGYDTPEPAERDPVVRNIYTAPGWENSDIQTALSQYDVAYIYVGDLERSTYGVNGRLPGLNKFNEQLEVAYQNGSVTIYRWQSNN
jgi:YYY domain-containing protein